MYECIGLNKKNINYFIELNKAKDEFNILNKDFFQVYTICNFAQQILLRRKVKLLKNNYSYIGYIWSDINDKDICNINAMNVLTTFNNLKSYAMAYKFMINTLTKTNTINYLCENNDYNFKILNNIGFVQKEGTLILYSNIRENIPLILDDEFQFEILNKGIGEQKRCEIQNKIFEDDNRIPLTIDDIYFDEIQEYYFDRGAVFLKKNGQYIGYGQIIIEDNIPMIVNFGIIKEYRGNGYSKILLIYLLHLIKANGFNLVKIKVKSTNIIALTLYKSLGFKIKNEIYKWEINKK